MSEKRVSTTDFEDSVQICLQDEKPVVVIENTKHELSVKECPVKNVTVFVDRAEVNRIVEAEIKQGDMEVLVKDLPALIDKDSVRYALLVSVIATFFRKSWRLGKSFIGLSSKSDFLGNFKDIMQCFCMLF